MFGHGFLLYLYCTALVVNNNFDMNLCPDLEPKPKPEAGAETLLPLRLQPNVFASCGSGACSTIPNFRINHIPGDGIHGRKKKNGSA
jgi:hypothetical protein